MTVNIPSYRITSPIEGLAVAECSNMKSVITADYKQLFTFIYENPSGTSNNACRVVWRLSDLISIIKSMLPAGSGEEFAKRVRNGYCATWFDDGWRFRIFYQPGKFFSINRRKACDYGDNEIYIYELDQFFPDHREINSIADIAVAAAELSVVFESLGVDNVDNLKSPVASLEESSSLVNKAYNDLPDISDIPVGCRQYALDSDLWGAWTSAYQVGYWAESYGADISSCYPSLASKLISLDGAEYVYSRKMQDWANYGFLKGTLYIDPEHPFAWCSPIVAPLGNNIIGNPVGYIKGTFTLEQVKFVERYEMGTFQLSSGWFIRLKSGIRPLHHIMSTLYANRKQGELMSYCCKRAINGIIGRLGQYINNKPTDKTNELYHALIRNTASLLVAETLIQQNIQRHELLTVNTDGFRVTRPVSFPEHVSTMGKWRAEPMEPVIVLSPDRVYAGDRCATVYDTFNKNKRSSSYPELDINLLSLSADQDRYFPKYPKTGGDALRVHYTSEEVVND